MARAGESIYLRKDGRYEGRYIVSRDEGGKAKYASVYGRSMAEAREKLRQKKEEAGIAAQDPAGRTFREAAEAWLKSKRERIAATTYSRYMESLERNLYPEYGDTPVGSITDAEIARFAKRVAEKAKNEGKEVNHSSLQMNYGILSMVLGFARGGEAQEPLPEAVRENVSYEALGAAEIERICLCAKHNKTPEMLAVLLSLFCGIRLGELCALDWADVSLPEGQIHVHKSVHRVRASGGSGQKTELRSEEIPTKKHIRSVAIPVELRAYMGDMQKPGCAVLSGKPHLPADARTVQNRVQRAFAPYRIEGVNFQRLRKSYVEGKADLRILEEAFGGGGAEAGIPCKNALDKEWLMVEMKNDLPSLRLLIGLSPVEMGEVLGLSEAAYQNMERGERKMDWGEYLSLLFFFHYNNRTGGVVDTLGLYPESLRESLELA